MTSAMPMPMSSSPSGKSLWRGLPRHFESKYITATNAGWPAAGASATPAALFRRLFRCRHRMYRSSRVDKYLTWGEPARHGGRERSKKVRAAAAKKGREVSFGIRRISLSARRTKRAWARRRPADLKLDDETIRCEAQEQFVNQSDSVESEAIWRLFMVAAATDWKFRRTSGRA